MIAILSDIHANLVALEAVLADMDSLGIETALCLGDTVGYGPDPDQCVALVRDRCVASVLGNHEALLVAFDQIQEVGFDDTVSAPLELARAQLGPEGIDWVKSLPIGIDLDAFEVVHASQHEPPAFHYIDSPESAAHNFDAQSRPVSFHGHTHVPAIWEKSETGRIRCYSPTTEGPIRLDADRTYAVNVGSIGQPRDQDPRATYAAYDYSTCDLVFRRVRYDIKQAEGRFRQAGLPAFNRTRLKTGK